MAAITSATRSPRMAVPQRRAAFRDLAVEGTLGASQDVGSRSAETSLVPSVTVMGRSVLSRSVIHGMPRAVASSWTPPESVMTSWEQDISP